MPDPRVIGVDLGGTKILTGIVARDGTVERRRETTTPTESQDALLAGLDAAVEALLDDSVVGLGFGVPSRLDQKTGRVEGSVNIPLEGLDFRARMSERFLRPVGIENDANAATYGEFHSGAGRGWAEFGHMVIEYDGIPCQGSCTGRGHLEPYVTGTAATKLAREAFGPAADAHRLIRLADEGDQRAREILDGMGRRLGAGIGSLVNIFDPELVVIGGGFAAAWEFLVEPAHEVMEREVLAPAGGRVRIARAELGTAAGLIGAGLVAFDAADGL
ncbi:MAG: ROK family protein [Actinobacteria bacterium]|nr:MAG: ROK family protein [Actinomycetota bacterium]